jgi:fructose/tagatose bisphosphate aldolase
MEKIFNELNNKIGNCLTLVENDISVNNKDTFTKNIEQIARISSTNLGKKSFIAQYIIRKTAIDFGIYPASIQDLYIAMGNGKVPNTFSVPAINLRVLTFHAAREVFKLAVKMDISAILFEIARSEIGYTNQRPQEYSASLLAAAIDAGYKGPVFIQGDHFQISAARYTEDASLEIGTVKELAKEAIDAGFYNIDVDSSTLVDLTKSSIEDQQLVNTKLSAEISAHIRSVEPEGITVSIGGEIGEVGGKNSTEAELVAYMDGYIHQLKNIGSDLIGISKISIQTGTSHGGVVLPDGSIAQVNVDFDTLEKLSQIAKKKYGLAGAVQHGASTLPQEAFGKFVEAKACEVHLATNFQNIFYDNAPEDLVTKIYKNLFENNRNEYKEGMTEDQFYYKTRKRALGAFKAEIWNLTFEQKNKITSAWEKQFTQLFTSLGISGTKKFTDETVKPVFIQPDYFQYVLKEKSKAEEDVSDLAD